MAPWLVVNTAMSGIWRVTYAGICPVIVGSTRSALRLDAFPMTGMRMGASLSVSERDQVSTGADRHGRRIQVVRAWTTTTGRMEMDLSIHRRVEWSIRCAGTGVVSPETGRKETGLLMGIGCQWTPSSYLQLEARWTAFGTDSYDTRMYQGEQLVPGTARYVLIYGEGDRSGVWLRITPWHGAGITTAVTRTSRLTERGAAVVRSACAVQLDVRM
jgi:hypothetical protein